MTSALESKCSFTPFAPRPIASLGLREVSGWALKTYGVTLPGVALDEKPFIEGLGDAASHLPEPPTEGGRLGVGFVIFHQAQALDYLVLAWWGRENELSVRVFIRERNEPGSTWRAAQGDESYCVWDLEIIWHERNAWVETVMARGSASDYLARTITKAARS